jgi:four helix bundle protein
MRTHENLDVWKKAVDFVVDIYRATDGFPKEERFGLTSQLRRAAVSIPANLSEGVARSFPKETLHFISNAQGSASEVSTELVIAYRLGFISQEEYGKLTQDCDEISRMMTGLGKYMRSKA